MKQLYLASLILMSIFMISCNRYYYKPNGVNTPLFTDKNQLHINVAGSAEADGSGKTSFLDLQGAWSPIKHLGIIANYSTCKYTPEELDYDEGDVPAKAHLLEGGIGGYYGVGAGKVKMVMDIYTGAGIGSLRSDVNIDAVKLFIQPGIGMTSPWFDASINLRLSNINYNNFNDNGRNIDYLENRGLINYGGKRIDNGSYTFIEPAFTIRAGYKFAKVQLQYVLSDASNQPAWEYKGSQFTAGFYFSLEGLMDVTRNGVERPQLPPLPPLPEHRHL